MNLFGELITPETVILLVLALGLAFGFEFVNGFHDTANAVATVIYTHSLKPVVAVIWSGMWNLIGVLTSSGAVAFSIVSLLPVELVLNVGSGPSFAMVFSLLVSAILWNLGTWYLGLPASSSHTLIGSIIGVGLANSLISAGHTFGDGVNWGKAKEVFASLLISPIVGFCGAALLLLLARAVLRQHPELFQPPEGKKAPPFWIRALLVLTCTGVSFAHGSNDGQKGMGLIVLILVGILPGIYALNLTTNPGAVNQLYSVSQSAIPVLERHANGANLSLQAATEELSGFLKETGKATDQTFAALAAKSRAISTQLSGKQNFQALSQNDRLALRSNFYLTSATIDKLNKQNKLTDPQEKAILTDFEKNIDKQTKFIPNWVKVGVALSLGLGTMVGWKRIVITVGEKIGKQHLTYGQGASAELVAMSTILAADHLGLPVSTTHVLSSGVAGTMAANHSGLQMDTLRNIALAWVLTLPVCVFLGAMLYAAGFFVVLRFVGVH